VALVHKLREAPPLFTFFVHLKRKFKSLKELEKLTVFISKVCKLSVLILCTAGHSRSQIIQAVPHLHLTFKHCSMNWQVKNIQSSMKKNTWLSQISVVVFWGGMEKICVAKLAYSGFRVHLSECPSRDQCPEAQEQWCLAINSSMVSWPWLWQCDREQGAASHLSCRH
jgi:hypothetical protein